MFAGEIKFGDVGQTATAFDNIAESLSFFRNAYDGFAVVPRRHHPAQRTGRRQRQGTPAADNHH